VAAPLRFEVLRFSATPASAEVALLELEGRFRAPARRRLGAPRLLAEEGTVRMEVGAAEGGDATAEPDGVRWRASFAVPLRLLDSGSFALAVGRELLVDLPDPDSEEHGNGSSDLHVRLAREANGLRQRADEAREAAAAALARADSERAARERAEAELRGAHHAREELATRLAQFETELAGRDAAVDALRVEHEAELERREQAFGAHSDERVAEAEAEAADLRRALKTARADIELLRRERDRANDRAAASVRTVPAPAARPPLPRDDGPHPEQDAAVPALPLPEGEAVGAPRPAPSRDPETGAEPETDAAPETQTRAEPESGTGQTRVHGEDRPGPATAAGAAASSRPPVALHETTDTLEALPNGALDADDTESVRVLGRRPPRTRSGQEPPSEPLPGTAEIGARHIVPGALGRGGVGPWLARLAAILALVLVVAAVLLVVWGVR
jgi:hypothetical protein